MKRRVVALAGVGLLALAACGQADPAASGGSDGGGETSAAATEDRHRAEVGALTPRIVLAHDGGVTTLDSADGEVLDDTEMNGYVRLNPAGDGRHVMVSAEESFTAYDTGLEATAHGDHFHYYEQDPALTGITLDAPSPGHVVTHGDRAALFADGTGAVTVYDPASLAEGPSRPRAPARSPPRRHSRFLPPPLSRAPLPTSSTPSVRCSPTPTPP